MIQPQHSELNINSSFRASCIQMSSLQKDVSKLEKMFTTFRNIYIYIYSVGQYSFYLKIRKFFFQILMDIYPQSPLTNVNDVAKHQYFSAFLQPSFIIKELSGKGVELQEYIFFKKRYLSSFILDFTNFYNFLLFLNMYVLNHPQRSFLYMHTNFVSSCMQLCK